MRAALAEGGAVGATSRVLEVGCGTGNYILALAAGHGCEAHGIERSGEMCTVARSRGGAVSFHEGSAENLSPVGDGFSFVYTVDVIHHMTDRGVYFAGAAGALASGGRLCMVTDSETIVRSRMPLAAYFPDTIAVELDRYPPIPALRDQMASTGFSDITEQDVSHAYDLSDATAYRARAFSGLHYIDDDAFNRGLARLQSDLATGPRAALRVPSYRGGRGRAATIGTALKTKDRKIQHIDIT